MSRQLIDRDELISKLKKHRTFYVSACGSFSELPEKEQARVDEITVCIAELINAPTIDAVELPLKIGEKCYCILNHKNEVIEDIVDDYDIWSIKDGVKLRITLKNYNDYVVGEFDKGVFRTREEAQAAIEGKCER